MLTVDLTYTCIGNMPSVMHCKLIGAERVFPLPSMKKERSGFARHNIVKQLLFELIDCRLPTRPIVITSQKNVIDYLALLGGDSRAEAIVDRLLKPCKVITLVGKSKREILK